ncbi:hypothetical protein BN1723_000529 [Verticillium longisporum]|uniref:Uncharacterized protein n=1 Tax=Verticillium longisporum TaxID=100787 RepID=A0A0G4LKU1_VERLO|nr:hypothetical protein BN1708_003599 [Verticillium longisporum]CRK29595.1 hypothetical protein BN1723_000529 [Verticillium longisporum]
MAICTQPMAGLGLSSTSASFAHDTATDVQLCPCRPSPPPFPRGFSMCGVSSPPRRLAPRSHLSTASGLSTLRQEPSLAKSSQGQPRVLRRWPSHRQGLGEFIIKTVVTYTSPHAFVPDTTNGPKVFTC